MTSKQLEEDMQRLATYRHSFSAGFWGLLQPKIRETSRGLPDYLCALSQLQLVASGPGVGKVSEPLPLTCAVSGVSITSRDYLWHWLRQPPGQGLEYMGRVYLYSRSRHAPSLQGQITISADTAKNQVSLTLRSLTAADTATYYCAWRDTVTRRPGAWDTKGASHTRPLPERRHLTLPLPSAPFRCPLKETLCQRPPGSWREAEKEEAPELVNGQPRVCYRSPAVSESPIRACDCNSLSCLLSS
ncbi:unnamed protein product [Eretmochelys imbricata]